MAKNKKNKDKKDKKPKKQDKNLDEDVKEDHR